MARRYALIPDSQEGLDKLKENISAELGIESLNVPEGGHWGYYPAHRCGEVGGSMVKKMIEAFESNLAK